MADFKSKENLEALLKALEDSKQNEMLAGKIDQLVEKTPRTSSVKGDLFTRVGEAVGESYGQGYKPNFVLSRGDDMLPAVIKGAAGSKQLVPTGVAGELVGEAAEVGARNLPTIAKQTLPDVIATATPKLASGLGRVASLAGRGAIGLGSLALDATLQEFLTKENLCLVE